MNHILEKLNTATDLNRGWGRIILPFIVALATLFGAKIVFPKEQVSSLAAQVTRTDHAVDSAFLRMDRMDISAANRDLAHTRQIEGLERAVQRVLILSCAKERPGSTVYKLAECGQGVAP